MLRPWIVLAVVASLFLVIYLLGRFLIRIRATERIHCPVKDDDYEVESVWSSSVTWGLGKRVDIRRCSAFDNPELITCEKACMRGSVGTPMVAHG